MILSIVTSRDTTEVMTWVRDQLGDLTNRCDLITVPTPVKDPGAEKVAHVPLEKEQVAIYAGAHLPGASAAVALDLRVATAILSDRLYLNLREKQGLAYSTGAGARFDREFGWYYLVISTGSENYQTAMDGLTLQTEKLAFDGPTPDEVKKVKNQIWGRLMSAKLSRINQAYYLGLDELYGRDIGYDQLLLKHLAEVNVESVRDAAARYFRPGSWVIATAGKK